MSGHVVAQKIRLAVQPLGRILLFRAYFDTNIGGSKGKHEELRTSGVNIVHTPHKSKKEVADKVLIVDLMDFALSELSPAIVVLITGDRDFAHALSVIRKRGHEVYLIRPPQHTQKILIEQANGVLNWRCDVLEHPDPGLKFRYITSTVCESQCLAQKSDTQDPDLHVAKRARIEAPACTAPSDNDESTLSGGVAMIPLEIHPFRPRHAEFESDVDVATDEDDVIRLLLDDLDTANVPFTGNVLKIDGDLVVATSTNDYLCYSPVNSVAPITLNTAAASSKASSARSPTSNGKPASAAERFSVLVKILKDEEASGRPCTSIKKVETLLHQKEGFGNVKRYLKLARHAKVVRLSGISWANKEGYVYLCNEQPDRACSQLEAGSSSSLTDVYDGDPRFVLLIQVLRELQAADAGTLIKRAMLINILRERNPLIYEGFAKPKAYMSKAQDARIIVVSNDGKGTPQFVHLHPDYY